MAGEIDSRVVTPGVASTLQANWTGTAAGWWVCAVVAFNATPGGEPEPELLIETLAATDIYSRGGRIRGRILPAWP